MRGPDFFGTALGAGESGPSNSGACSGTAAWTLTLHDWRDLLHQHRREIVSGLEKLNSLRTAFFDPFCLQIASRQIYSQPRGTKRFYGAGGEEMASSSLHVTDGVPRFPSRTT